MSKLNTSLVDQIYQREKQKIVNLECRLGEKIILREKSEEYDVSLTPIIQALNYLVKDGLVTKKARKGYCIKVMSSHELEDLHKVRELIETESLKMANHIDIKRLEKLLYEAKRTIQENCDSNNRKPKRYCDFDKNFHLFIVENSHNQLLYQWYKNILPQIQISQNLGSFYKNGMEEHIKIINYLLENDLKSAIKEMRIHLENWKQNSLMSLKSYNSIVDRSTKRN